MLKYRFVNHTADIEYIAYGKNLEELFSNAVLALMSIASDTGMLKSLKSKSYIITVKEKAAERSSLLWGTLQGILSKCEARGLFGYEVKSLNIKYLKGIYYINALVLARRKCVECAKLDVKGVSKYDMHIIESKHYTKAYVVIDV